MTASQKITVVETAEGRISVNAEPAELLDTVTTLISTDSAVTGLYGLGQKIALVVGGMALNSKMKTGSFNFIK